MDVLTLDAPLLIIGLPLLVLLRLTRPNHVFQVWCQFAATFWAQYSWLVSWSLAKLVPILSATSPGKTRTPILQSFLPLIVYTVVSSGLASLFWKIPPDVNPVYGDYRVGVQLVGFMTLVLGTRGLFCGLLHRSAALLLWQILTAAVLIHGMFASYQLFSWVNDLPLIGMSRPHGQTMEEGIGDVAKFSAGDIEIVRIGGLAGEPKTAAVIFGIYFFAHLICGLPKGITIMQRILGIVAVGLSLVSFLLTFSTSGFVAGAIATIFVFILLQKNLAGVARLFGILACAIGFAFIISQTTKIQVGEALLALLEMRTVGRLEEEIDAPVEAAMSILKENPAILFFGTGLGGGSFSIMDYLGTTNEYAMAPNVGAVLLILESGIIGASLLLVPYAVLGGRALRGLKKINEPDVQVWGVRYLCGVSITAMCFMLAGSGMPMGYVLAIACIGAAAHLVTPNGKVRAGEQA